MDVVSDRDLAEGFCLAVESSEYAMGASAERFTGSSPFFRTNSLCIQHGVDLAVRPQGGDFVLHILQRHIMMFAVVGIDAIGCQNQGPIPLIGVNCGGADRFANQWYL